MLHDREMYGITRRQLPIPQDNLFRALCDRPINRQHLIHYAKQSVERRLDCVAAVDSDVTVQAPLENRGRAEQSHGAVTSFSDAERFSMEILHRYGRYRPPRRNPTCVRRSAWHSGSGVAC